MSTALFPDVVASTYALTIAGIERTVLLDGTLDLQLVANGIDTLNCSIDSFDGKPRPTVRDELILFRDGVPVFGGVITQTPEQALGGPALDDYVTQVAASSFKLWATYRFVTLTIPPGSLRDALAALAPFLASHGITLDPMQAVGPGLPELVLTQTRLDAAFEQIVVLTDYGYVWEITPTKLLRMVAIATTRAPYDVLDTGEPRQVGDVRVERSLDDTFANAVTVSVTGAGPATSAESFHLPDGVTVGGFLRFVAKYPASQSIDDAWPNELYFDGVPQGPIAWGVADLVSYGGSFAWGWDYQSSPAALVFDLAAGAPLVAERVRRAGRAWRSLTTEEIAIVYAIRYPYTVTAHNLADQAAHGIYEAVVSIPEAMTIDAAQKYAEAATTAHSAVARRAFYSSPFPGVAPGQLQRMTLAKRAIDEECLIAEVRMSPWSSAEPGAMIFEVTLVVGSSVGGLWRDVYRKWLGGGGGGSSGGVFSTGGGGGGAALGGIGCYPLATSRVEWVQGASWQAASGIQIVLDTVARGKAGAVVMVRLRARDPGISVTPRLQNLTDGTTAGVGDPVTSTTFVTVAFAAALATGSKAYELQLLASAPDHDVQAVGYLE